MLSSVYPDCPECRPAIWHVRARFKCRLDADGRFGTAVGMQQAMMIDNTLDVGHNWRKTSGKRSMLICATGIYAATQDGGYGCWPPACDVVLSLLCIPFGFHGEASKMLGRRARLGPVMDCSSRCPMISWYGVVMIWTFNWVVVSNIFYFHPYLGKIPNLTNICQSGWNHQLV